MEFPTIINWSSHIWTGWVSKYNMYNWSATTKFSDSVSLTGHRCRYRFNLCYVISTHYTAMVVIIMLSIIFYISMKLTLKLPVK